VVDNILVNADEACGPRHYWQQVCSKALACGTNRNVFVITANKSVALKFTPRGEAPRSLQVYVKDMDPDGAGDAKVSDEDIILYFNGTNHYNALLSPAYASALERVGKILVRKLIDAGSWLQ